MLMQNFHSKSSGSKLLFAFAISFVCLLFGDGAARSFAQGNTPQRQNGKIAYATGGSHSHIYTINPDGSNNTDISSFPNPDIGGNGDYQPYFSWDGSKIYFRSYRHDYGYGEIYVMNANGGNITRLSYNLPDNFNPCPLDAAPAVSPDGTKIIFNAYGNNLSAMREMSASGYSNATNNCNGQPPMVLPDYWGFTPSYSPDGTKIIFDGKNRADAHFYRDVFVLNRSNSSVTRLTFGNSNADQYINARFSPDGSKIVCQHSVNNNGTVTSDIVVMDADGLNQTQLTTAGNDTFPAWSPDGTKIAFLRGGALYTMNANGANQTLVPNAVAVTSVSGVSWGASPYVSVAPTQNVNLQFSNVTSGGNTTAEPLPQNQFPASAPQNYTFPQNAPAYEISTTATFSGTVDVTLQVPNVASAADCSKLRILHYTNNAWDDSGNAAPQYNAGTMVCTLTQTVSSLSPFAVAQVLAPTAATVILSGRVMSGKRGIRNALVTLTEQDGTTHTVLTGASGNYRFEEVAAGQTVIVSVRAKRITFSQPTQIFTVTEDFTGVNFYAVGNYLSNLEW